MICKKCGKDIVKDKKFCGHCGNMNEPSSPLETPTLQKESTIPCPKCGFAMSDGSQFCAKCGESKLSQTITLPVYTQSISHQKKQGRNTKKYNGKPKEKNKIVSRFILPVIMIVIAAGIFTGYYVAKNGWSAIPFSDRLTFLPFINIPKETIYTYSDETKKSNDIESDKKRTNETEEVQTPVPTESTTAEANLASGGSTNPVVGTNATTHATDEQYIFKPEYYIPELNRLLTYQIINQNMTKSQNQEIWTQEGMYLIRNTMYDVNSSNNLHAKDKFELLDDALILRESEYESGGEKLPIIQFKGDWTVLKLCQQRGVWNSKTTYGSNDNDYEETIQGEFLKMDDVLIDGKKHKSFHLLTVQVFRSNEPRTKELWIVQGYGLVKQVEYTETWRYEMRLDGFAEVEN